MKDFLKDENGQGMVEYALIIGLIAIAAVAVIMLLGPKITQMFKKTDDAMSSALVESSGS